MSGRDFWMYVVSVYTGNPRRLLTNRTTLTYQEALHDIAKVVWAGYETRIFFAGSKIGKHEDRR